MTIEIKKNEEEIISEDVLEGEDILTIEPMAEDNNEDNNN